MVSALRVWEDRRRCFSEGEARSLRGREVYRTIAAARAASAGGSLRVTAAASLEPRCCIPGELEVSARRRRVGPDAGALYYRNGEREEYDVSTPVICDGQRDHGCYYPVSSALGGPLRAVSYDGHIVRDLVVSVGYPGSLYRTCYARVVCNERVP